MEKSENGQVNNSNYPNNSKAGSNQFEGSTASASSYLEVYGEENVANWNISTTTRAGSLSSALVVGKQTTMSNASDMTEYSSDDPATHAPPCMMCLKPATHFCELCEPRGKYICHACLQQHNRWCPDHFPDSLSVKRQIGQSNNKVDIPNNGHIRPDEWKHREERIPVTRGIEDYLSIESWLGRKNVDGNPDMSEARDVTEARDDMETLTSLDFPSTLNNFTDQRPIRVRSANEPPSIPHFRIIQPILPHEVNIETTTDGSHTTECVDYESIGTHLRPSSTVSDNWILNQPPWQPRQQQQQQRRQIAEIKPPSLQPFRFRHPILPPTPEVDIESTTDGSHTTEIVDEQSNNNEDIPNNGYIRPIEWTHREERITVARGREEYGYIERFGRDNADDTPDVSDERDATEARDDIETLPSLDFPSTLNNCTEKRPIRVCSANEPPSLPPFRNLQPILPPKPEVDIESTTDGSHTTECVDYDSIRDHVRPISAVSDNCRLNQTPWQPRQQQEQIAELDDINNSHYYDSYDPKFQHKTQKICCSII